jgi:hypothetical protein
MKVYLVYGLDKDDLCIDPYVKKAFALEKDAREYCNKSKVDYPSYWYVTDMEVE